MASLVISDSRNLFESDAHGIRTVDNLRKNCGITDPDELEVSDPSSPILWDVETSKREATRFEEAIVDTSTEDGRPGIILLPGVKEIMQEVCILSSP